MRFEWMDSFRLPEPTKAYWKEIRRRARPSRKELVAQLAIAAAVLVIVLATTKRIDVTLVATIGVLALILLVLWLRAVIGAAATRDLEQTSEIGVKKQFIADLNSQIDFARWGRQVRQGVLGDLLKDLPSRNTAEDVRKALLQASDRCVEFPDVPLRLAELAATYQVHGGRERDALIEAVRTLQTSSLADPSI